MIFFIGVLWIWFRDQWSKNQEAMEELEALDTSTLLTDKNALLKSGVVMGLVMIGFMVHGVFHLEPATIALGGAVILLLWTQKDVQTVLGDIEWATLFFFIGLFIAVEGLVQVGIIETIGEYLINITGGNLLYTSMLLLWMSSLFSGIVDNIPYTATMIPVVQSLEGALPLQPLWWSLALGACLGGNATLVGASANVVVANIAARGGYPISFRLFLRYGIIITVISLVIASFYIWMRYL
jgi:Na+/H+ antiporter NhaD/arsenite permease-like protein